MKSGVCFGQGAAPSGRVWMCRVGAALLLWAGAACNAEGPPDWPEGSRCEGEPGPMAAQGEAGGGPDCRPMYSGEAVINEVVLRPAGRDVDGDGVSDANDELIEVLNMADVPVHLAGAALWWGQTRRGGITASPCLPPGHAALITGAKAGALTPPEGAIVLALDRTLRLSDGGGTLRLTGLAGGVLDEVKLPPATDARRGCVARRADGDRWAPLVPHQDLERADGASMSPGLCTDGRRFPACVRP